MGGFPEVRIDSPGGNPMRTTVTVDGVPILCSKVTWVIDVNGVSRCTLEVPAVTLSAGAQQVIAKYVEPEADQAGG